MIDFTRTFLKTILLIQTYKTLKLAETPVVLRYGFRVIQTYKALKPQSEVLTEPYICGAYAKFVRPF